MSNIDDETIEYANEIAKRPQVVSVLRALKRLERMWPHDQPIKLVAMGLGLHLFAIREGGDMSIPVDGPNGWGMDENLVIETFNIPQDGGDW